MLQAMLAKKAMDIILKKVMEKREIKELRKYVEDDNELDIQVKQMQKTIAKQGKTIEKNEVDIAKLKVDSHPKKKFHFFLKIKYFKQSFKGMLD